jgi:hypothetical protein
MATQQMAVDSAERAYARSMLLAAPSRSPEIPESADAYGWLVGSWELDVWVYWAMDVRARGLKERRTSDGRWKAVLSRTSGSCPALRNATRIWTST